MRLAVTGATGYIGSHFVKVAAESGHQITATDYNMKQNDIQKYKTHGHIFKQMSMVLKMLLKHFLVIILSIAQQGLHLILIRLHTL